MSTPPLEVNFSAFWIRLVKIWFSLTLSVVIMLSSSDTPVVQLNRSPRLSASCFENAIISCKSLLIEVSVMTTFTSLASILDISIKSLIKFSMRSPLLWIRSIYSICSSPVRWGSLRSSEKPIIPFMGVRISWLILARNAVFNRSLSSAACLRSVMSWIIR